MQIELIQPDQLTDAHIEAWLRLCAKQSPYFHPRLTQLVGQVRDDARVAVLRDGDRIVGFFPHEQRRGVGRPIGGKLSDYHGIIAEPHTPIDPLELLRACRLTAWTFDHLPTDQTAFAPYAAVRDESPILDLSRGYDAYEADRIARGGKQLRETLRRERKLTREHGAFRFVQHADDPAVLDQLLSWKADQCRASFVPDFLALDWTRRLIRLIHAQRDADFAGQLSALYVNDRLIAAHFAMATSTVWHSWFPAYDPAFAPYSPGLILLLAMARTAAACGVQHIDLGKGMSTYKQSLMTGSLPLCEGVVELPSLATSARHARRAAEAWIRRSPLRTPARWVNRMIAPIEKRKQFQ
jgi:CelD/BcsL family acetyltransferase involved in cellulose biosynthesis